MFSCTRATSRARTGRGHARDCSNITLTARGRSGGGDPDGRHSFASAEGLPGKLVKLGVGESTGRSATRKNQQGGRWSAREAPDHRTPGGAQRSDRCCPRTPRATTLLQRHLGRRRPARAFAVLDINSAAARPGDSASGNPAGRTERPPSLTTELTPRLAAQPSPAEAPRRPSPRRGLDAPRPVS